MKEYLENEFVEIFEEDDGYSGFEKIKALEKSLDLIIVDVNMPGLDGLSMLKMLKDNKIFDLIFIDADKGNYINYFNCSLDLIKSGSVVIVDNVLWHGDTYNKNKNDKQTNTIREFNSYVKNDKRVEKFIIPLGDGLMVCRKL